MAGAAGAAIGAAADPPARAPVTGAGALAGTGGMPGATAVGVDSPTDRRTWPVVQAATRPPRSAMPTLAIARRLAILLWTFIPNYSYRQIRSSAAIIQDDISSRFVPRVPASAPTIS